jgi:hypothetical protein
MWHLQTKIQLAASYQTCKNQIFGIVNAAEYSVSAEGDNSGFGRSPNVFSPVQVLQG